MVEPINPPEGQPEVPATPPADTGKSAEELKKSNDRVAELERQHEEDQKMIGRQSTEIGELRKKEPVIKPPEPEIKDDDIKELAEDFIKKGLSEADAKFNAEVLIGFEKKRVSKKLQNDTLELIEESIEDGAIDRKVFDENKDEIYREFQGRRLAPTARKNLRTFKDCVEIVVKRKADRMKEDEKRKDEEKRTGLINEGAQPTEPSRREEAQKKEDDERRKEIEEAKPGDRGSSVFY